MIMVTYHNPSLSRPYTSQLLFYTFTDVQCCLDGKQIFFLISYPEILLKFFSSLSFAPNLSLRSGIDFFCSLWFCMISVVPCVGVIFVCVAHLHPLVSLSEVIQVTEMLWIEYQGRLVYHH